MNKYLSKLKIILIVFVVFLTSCTQDKDDYNGEYPELYSIAINSLLGAEGYHFGERKIPPNLKVIEEDEYGRKLYTYSEYNTVSAYSLIISQKSDDDYAYFYPDYNFISKSKGDFSGVEIEDLKKKNDWDKGIDVEKCIRVKITRKKGLSPIDDEDIIELYKKAFGKDALSIKSARQAIWFFIADDYGRSMYLGYGENKSYCVMLINPDGSYDEETWLMFLQDPNNYQDELKAFKELNDWNEPWTS